MNRVWDATAAEGRLCGITHSGGWCGLGDAGAVATAEALLAGGDV